MAESCLELATVDKDLCYRLGNIYLYHILRHSGDYPLECLKKIGLCQEYFSASGFKPPIGWAEFSQLRETLESHNHSY